MTKRLQVLLEESELREVRKAAEARRVTVAEWVRQALRDARRQAPLRTPEGKLAVIRAAARHEFPTADIERLLEGVERGYLSASES